MSNFLMKCITDLTKLKIAETKYNELRKIIFESIGKEDNRINFICKNGILNHVMIDFTIWLKIMSCLKEYSE